MVLGEAVAAEKQQASGGADETPVWPYEVDVGDHFETPKAAFEDVAPLLHFTARRRAFAQGHESSTAEAACRLRVYDPYFCTGRSVQLLGELGFPRVVNRKRDFYKDIAEGSLPRFHALVTNPPYSGDHKKRLFDFLLARQGEALRQGVPEPFMLLLPSWTVSKVVFKNFQQQLAKLRGEADNSEAGIFYVCRRGRKGRPAKYEFDHVHGAGLAKCPFFGVWICGGFGDAASTARAARRAARAGVQGFWAPDERWLPCRPHPVADAIPEVSVTWEDGTWSELPPDALSGGRLVYTSVAGLEASGLSRSAEDVRQRLETNVKQKQRRELALQALDRERVARREALGLKRKRGRGPTAVQCEEPLGKTAATDAPGVCRHFFSEKGCNRGDKCKFSHDRPGG